VLTWGAIVPRCCPVAAMEQVVVMVVVSGGVGIVQGGYGPVTACRVLTSGVWVVGHDVGCLV